MCYAGENIGYCYSWNNSSMKNGIGEAGSWTIVGKWVYDWKARIQESSNQYLNIAILQSSALKFENDTIVHVLKSLLIDS